jgi:ATP-binding cassette subfamily B protein
MTKDRPKLSRWAPYLKRRKVILFVVALAIVTSAFETAAIVTIVSFIEGVTNSKLFWEVSIGPLDLVLGRSDLVLIGLTALLLMTAGQLLSRWTQTRASSHFGYQLQMQSIRGYTAASWEAQSSESSGSLQNLMNLSGGAAQGLGAVMSMTINSITLLIFVCGAFLAAPAAAGALLVAGVLLMSGLRPIRTAARKATHASTLASRQVTISVSELHDLAQEIRVNNAGPAVLGRMSREGKILRRSNQRRGVLTGLGSVLYRSVGLAFLLAAAVFASRQADIDVARVGVAGLLLLRSLSYGSSLQAAWQTLENNRPYVEQMDEALDRYESTRPNRGILAPDDLGEIELSQVSYRYQADGPAALEGLDLTVAAGETIGVVGPSGSGKSTLVQILLGLREATTGTYLVGGVPTMEISADAWFRLVALVPQQPKLLRDSVVGNIVFHRPWISSEDAQEAAIAAGLHDEIMALPDGYQTQIGDAVRDLSGGQRQRLGIARALAGKPRLLVLDEPTSALDAMSESRVQDALMRLKGSVTVVIIAHRLATLNHCDRLLVLEAGVVSVLDTPSEVMQQSEFYRDAVRMQLIGDVESGSRVSGVEYD